jgi:DNA-binding MarR family transcriptional regulator
MTEKITPIEQKIIEYLALNPSQNAQVIQRAIGLEDINYPTVSKALKRMQEEKHWLKSCKGQSERHLTIKFYSLTDFGIGVALARGPEEILRKTLKVYESEYGQFEVLFQFVDYLKPSTVTKLFRLVGNMVMKYGRKAWEPETLGLNAVSGIGNFTPEEIESLAAIRSGVKERIRAVYEEW